MTIRDMIPNDRPSMPMARERIAHSLGGFQNELTRLIHEFFGNNGVLGNRPWAQWTSDMWSRYPAVDVIENEKDFQVRVEIPGYDPEKVDVSVRDGFLTIRGERCSDKDSKDDNYLRHETSCGSFERTLALPETAHPDKAEASFKNGMLYIAVPKKAEALQKPRKIEVKKVA